MQRSRWLSLAACVTLAAGLGGLAGPAAAAGDVCGLLKKHAPKDVGLALDKAVSATPQFCQANSPDNKDTLLLRVSPMGRSTAAAVSGTRQGAVNSGNGTVADETGLGAGAWSKRTKRGIEITFAAKESLVMVMLNRDGGFSDADAAKARGFARAVAGELR